MFIFFVAGRAVDEIERAAGAKVYGIIETLEVRSRPVTRTANRRLCLVSGGSCGCAETDT